MKVLSTDGDLRECFRVSPWFYNDEGNEHLNCRLHFWYERLLGADWIRLVKSRDDQDVTLREQPFDPATRKLGEGNTTLLTFIYTADAVQMGITALQGQPVFPIIGEFLEDIILANGPINPNINEVK